jgi:hypothetical protein
VKKLKRNTMITPPPPPGLGDIDDENEEEKKKKRKRKKEDQIIQALPLMNMTTLYVWRIIDHGVMFAV